MIRYRFFRYVHEYPIDLTEGPEREPVGIPPFLLEVYDGAQSSGRGCCAPWISGWACRPGLVEPPA